jgi:hypothetical protein
MVLQVRCRLRQGGLVLLLLLLLLLWKRGVWVCPQARRLDRHELQGCQAAAVACLLLLFLLLLF